MLESTLGFVNQKTSKSKHASHRTNVIHAPPMTTDTFSLADVCRQAFTDLFAAQPWYDGGYGAAGAVLLAQLSRQLAVDSRRHRIDVGGCTQGNKRIRST